jgi:hypothetical protein
MRGGCWGWGDTKQLPPQAALPSGLQRRRLRPAAPPLRPSLTAVNPQLQSAAQSESAFALALSNPGGVTMNVGRIASIVGSATLLTSACAETPMTSQNLHEATMDAHDHIANYSNRMVLENILRAKEYTPLNYSDLGSISDNASATSTISFTLPFGYLHGANNRNSFAPSEVLADSPTATVSSLNEQAFVALMMQPTNPLYIQGKWNAGYNDKLLMMLFIKSIKFANSDRPIINNPDDDAQYSAFVSIINQLSGHVRMKTVTIMEPIGGPIKFGGTQTTTTYAPVSGKGIPDKSYNTIAVTVNDLTGVTLAQTIGDTQLHLGNLICQTAESCEFGQVYRYFPQQVLLCSDLKGVDALGADGRSRKYEIADADTLHKIETAKAQLKRDSDDLDVARKSEQLEAAARGRRAAAAHAKRVSLEASVQSDTLDLTGLRKLFSKEGVQPLIAQVAPAAKAAAVPAGPAAAPGGPAQASANMAVALATNRLGVVVLDDVCRDDEIVMAATKEAAFADNTAKFTDIEWRSAAEVIDYLGALARHSPNTPSSPKGEVGPYFFTMQATNWSNADRYMLAASYRGTTYGIGRLDDHHSLTPDEISTLQSFRMARELVDAAKAPSSSTIPQPIQFVP